jgi:hypothetical protein
MKKILTGLAFALISFTTVQAQVDSAQNASSGDLSEYKPAPIRKLYWGNNLDGMIFSAARLDPKLPGQSQAVRFSLFLNVGFTYNYNFCKSFGIYTGLDMKNIGYIDKTEVLGTGEVTTKRRVYTVGMPIGFRLGKMEKRDYLFAGGGMDLAFHYKEKQWVNSRSNKTKFSEWFSGRSETFLPYVFIGFGFHGTTIRFQYYPGSFMNQDYSTVVGGLPSKPYSLQKVNLFLFSIGKDMHYGRK